MVKYLNGALEKRDEFVLNFRLREDLYEQQKLRVRDHPLAGFLPWVSYRL